MSVTNLYRDMIATGSGTNDDDNDSSDDDYDSSNDDDNSTITFYLSGDLTVSFDINGDHYVAYCDCDPKCCEDISGIVEYDDIEYTSGDVFSIPMPGPTIKLAVKLISRDPPLNYDSDTSMVIRVGLVRIIFRNIQNGYYSHRPSLSVNDTELTYAFI